MNNLLNPPAVVAWNTDKRYLGDLADHGVPMVPGELYALGEQVRLPRTGHVFVGPAVGTGTRRFNVKAATARVAELHNAGRSVVVQVSGAATETALVFLGGKPSHAFTARTRFRNLGCGLQRAGRRRGTGGHRRGGVALRAGPSGR